MSDGIKTLNEALGVIATRRRCSVQELEIILGDEKASLIKSLDEFEQTLRRDDFELHTIRLFEDIEEDGKVSNVSLLMNDVFMYVAQKYADVELGVAEYYPANDNHVGGRYPGSWDGVDR